MPTPDESRGDATAQGGEEGVAVHVPPWTRPYRQRIRRPDEVALGGQPPWHELLDTLPAHLPLELLRSALPPLDADSLLALAPRSAVLVPIVERPSGSHVLLTRRSPHLALDPGNIAFPGGHVEAGEHPLEAALREAEEEIGLDPSAVEVLGTLDLVERVRDGQRVASVVGIVSSDATFAPSEHEVAALIEVPLAPLLAKGIAWEEHWGAERRQIRFFADAQLLGEDVVWGLTAKILWDLLERLARLLSTRP